MTLIDLADMVRKMRRYQTAYFATRSPRDLAYAKDWERRVDQAVADITNRQLALFPAGRTNQRRTRGFACSR